MPKYTAIVVDEVEDRRGRNMRTYMTVLMGSPSGSFHIDGTLLAAKQAATSAFCMWPGHYTIRIIDANGGPEHDHTVAMRRVHNRRWTNLS